MITRKPLIAAGAVLVAVGVAGCSSDDSDDTATATTTSGAAATSAGATTAAAANAPSVETLGATMATFFDPAVPAAEKVVLVDDGEKQAAVIEQFNGVLQGYRLTAEVTAVNPVDDDTVTSTTTIAGPHGGAPTEVVFEEENGAWVISTESLCTILGMGRLTCAQ